MQGIFYDQGHRITTIAQYTSCWLLIVDLRVIIYILPDLLRHVGGKSVDVMCPMAELVTASDC